MEEGLRAAVLGMWAMLYSAEGPGTKKWGPRPSNYPLLDSKYHQIRTIRFQLRVVGGSRVFMVSMLGIANMILGRYLVFGYLDP